MPTKQNKIKSFTHSKDKDVAHKETIETSRIMIEEATKSKKKPGMEPKCKGRGGAKQGPGAEENQ